MDPDKLRAWWFHRQALDGRLAGATAAECLAECGWARSVGGSAPYLGLFARLKTSREAVDADLAAVRIHELPAARGCTYVVPQADYALALRAGQPFGDGDMASARKLGVTDVEIDKLADAVVVALKKGPLDPDGLKGALGATVRSLGEEGRKKGVTTTLPLALGRLQTAGRIRRIPTNGRLDQQRYQYAVWEPNPLGGGEFADVFCELARRYFQWIGPATLAEFQWFSGLGVKAAKAAVESLKLIDCGSGLLMDAPLRTQYEAFRIPKSAQYALTGSIDSIVLLRRNLKTLLSEGELQSPVQVDRGMVGVGALADLPSHAILDRGRVIGLWEFDPERGSIAWATFSGKKDAGLKKCVGEVEAFVREDLGDARSFSLDSPKSRAPRIAALERSGG